jgi:8-oxo-dGTP diphosphatase
MPYNPILATLGYILSPDKTSVLMLHRNSRLDDQHFGKYNGLGGKIEPQEDVVSGMRREIWEESALEVRSMTLRGTINWLGFGKNGESWFVFIFRIDDWQGTPLTSNEEGTLEWIPLPKIMDLNLWPGDKFFLPLVFNTDSRQFHGVMPYENGEMVSWNYQLI